MRDRSDPGVRLSRFLAEEAPAHAPERLVTATRERLLRTHQRRRPGALGWRLSRAILNPVGALSAILLVVAIGTAVLLASRPGPSVGTRPYVCPSGGGTCLGPLESGDYRSSSFVPTVRYAVPAGWSNTLDVGGELDLQYAAGGNYRYPDGLTFHDGVSIFRRPVAESNLSKTPQTGVGTTANDLAQWLVGHADLIASAPSPVTINGASGYRLTLSLPQGTRSGPDHCTTDHGEARCESLFLGGDPQAAFGFGLVGPEIAVVYLLDLPSGDTVMAVIDDVDGVDQPGLESSATPVVTSLSFLP